MAMSKISPPGVQNGAAVSNHVVVVVSGLLSVGPFFIVGWWCSNPYRDLLGVNFSIERWVGFQHLADTCFVMFSQLLDCKCAYIPGSVCMNYFDRHSQYPNPFAHKPTLPQGQTEGHFL